MICARSEVGLSRLPVTEEIAGSNPVERATDNSPLDRVFFYGKYSIFIAFMCNLCYDIANWTVKSKEFYNKIPDNVRERRTSVMAKNHENPNPSGSEKILSRRKAIKVLGEVGTIAAAAVFVDACSAKKVPDAKQTTPVSSIGTEPKKPTESSTPETKEIKINKEAVTKLYEDLNKLKKEFDGASEEEIQEKHLRSAIRTVFVEAINKETGYQSTSFDPEAGSWRTNEENFNKTQDEMIGTLTAGLVFLGNITAICHKNNSFLPRTSENDLTAKDMMGMYLEAFTAGHGRDQIERFNETIEKYPGAIENFVYKGPLGDGELPKALHISYGLRTNTDDPLANCDSENNPNQCKNIFNQAGEKSPIDGGVHKTVEAVYPVNNTADLIIAAVNMIRVEGTDIRWLNEKTNKLGRQFSVGDPEKGSDFYMTPVIVWCDLSDRVSNSMPIYDGRTPKQPRDIPEVKKYMDEAYDRLKQSK